MDKLVLYIGIIAIVINYIFFMVYVFEISLSKRGIKKIHRNKKLLHENILSSETDISRIGNLSLTVVIPAYNEEKTITNSVLSFLNQNYNNIKVYIVNDGSSDGTKEKVLEYFSMEEIDALPKISDLTMQPVTEFYHSTTHNEVYLINKLNGGKSDALNAGINYVDSDYTLLVDADTMLEKNSLVNLMAPYYFKNDIVSIGGLVRPMTRKENLAGRSLKIRTKKFLPAFQYLEYLRSVLVFRSSLSTINSTVIVSGAFGVYETSIIRDIEGFSVNTIGEDFDLTLSIRKHIDDNKLEKRQIFLYDAVCWTQPPSTVKDLVKQRSRWQIGFLQTIFKFKGMIFNRKYGKVGMIGLPLFIFTEIISLLMETLGVVIGLGLLIAGLVSLRQAVFIFVLSYFVNLFFTLVVIIQNAQVQKTSYKDMLFLLFLSYIEAFSYHWVTIYSKLVGTIKFIFKRNGKHEWGEIKRDDIIL